MFLEALARQLRATMFSGMFLEAPARQLRATMFSGMFLEAFARQLRARNKQTLASVCSEIIFL